MAISIGSRSSSSAASSASGINYVTNSTAEGGTTGWSTYLDLAAASPVDGTGGTSTLTFTASATTPLRGLASFLITQPNLTNVQGNGVSTDFTIANADKAKPLVISFAYNASSSFTASSGQTSSPSDIEVFVYDITNAVLIPVSPKVLVANGANNFEFQGEFQTASNSTSYRLILHCATTNAPATGFQLKFDDVFVGPQAITHGAAITDWTSYTPTLTGFGTPTNVEFEYRRVGDNYEVKGTFITGTTTAVEARLSLPNSSTAADTTKIPSIRLCGQVARGGAASAYTAVPVLISPSVGYVNFGGAYSGGTSSGLSTITPQLGNTFVTGEKQVLHFSLPIAGFSSTVEMSQDTDTRVVAAEYTVIDTAVANNIETAIPLTTRIVDTHGAVSSNQFRVPVSGLYKVIVKGGPATSVAGGYVIFKIRKNGTDFDLGHCSQFSTGNSSPYTYTTGSWFVNCISGDLLDARIQYGSAASTTVTATVIFERLSGPAAVAASEVVAARYSTEAGQSITTTAVVDFGTKDFDTHSAVTTGASWKFTAPTSGIYSIQALVSFGSNTFTIGNAVFMEIFKNNTVHSVLHYDQADATRVALPTVTGGDTIRLLAGDFIDLRASHQEATARALFANAAYNHIAITRVGN